MTRHILYRSDASYKLVTACGERGERDPRGGRFGRVAPEGVDWAHRTDADCDACNERAERFDLTGLVGRLAWLDGTYGRIEERNGKLGIALAAPALFTRRSKAFGQLIDKSPFKKQWFGVPQPPDRLRVIAEGSPDFRAAENYIARMAALPTHGQRRSRRAKRRRDRIRVH